MVSFFRKGCTRFVTLTPGASTKMACEMLHIRLLIRFLCAHCVGCLSLFHFGDLSSFSSQLSIRCWLQGVALTLDTCFAVEGLQRCCGLPLLWEQSLWATSAKASPILPQVSFIFFMVVYNPLWRVSWLELRLKYFNAPQLLGIGNFRFEAGDWAFYRRMLLW